MPLGGGVTKSLEANETIESLVSRRESSSIAFLLQVSGTPDQRADGEYGDKTCHADLICRYR